MGICNQKISTQRARKRFGGNANNVDTIGKGRLNKLRQGKAKVLNNNSCVLSLIFLIFSHFYLSLWLGMKFLIKWKWGDLSGLIIKWLMKNLYMPFFCFNSYLSHSYSTNIAPLSDLFWQKKKHGMLFYTCDYLVGNDE